MNFVQQGSCNAHAEVLLKIMAEIRSQLLLVFNELPSHTAAARDMRVAITSRSSVSDTNNGKVLELGRKQQDDGIILFQTQLVAANKTLQVLKVIFAKRIWTSLKLDDALDEVAVNQRKVSPTPAAPIVFCDAREFVSSARMSVRAGPQSSATHQHEPSHQCATK